MDVFISINSKNRIYHRIGCPYAVRMLPKNRKSVYLNSINREGYCACKYCFSKKGRAIILQRLLEEAVSGRKMDCWYSADTDTNYLRTEMGFWKFFWKEKAEGYLLYHLNDFNYDLSFEQMIHGKFHRQSDVSATAGMKKILDYVEAHDKAKKTIETDYRKLPKRTKKQKDYYKKAKNRANRYNLRRVYDLVDLLSCGADNKTLLAY